MSFRVEITVRAAEEVRQGFRWLAERSPAAAERWRASLLAAIASLAEAPDRCALAPEEEWYQGGLRQLLHGKRRRVYRILFEVRGDVALILCVRHAAQALLEPDDL
jgi:plasmid stabilization system protein ParE